MSFSKLQKPFQKSANGHNRRDFMRIGSVAGLGMAEIMQMQQLAAAEGKDRSDINCIFIFIVGGMPQQDMWDLKPEAPAEIRGEFNPIQTNVNGIQISEHMPYMSKIMDKCVPLRAVVGSPNGSHDSYICYTCLLYTSPSPRD